MSNVTYKGSLTVNKPSIMDAAQGASYGPIETTMSGSIIAEGVVSVGTSSVALSITGMASVGLCVFKNNDTAGTVAILDHNQTGNPTINQIPPSQASGGFWPPPGCIPYIIGSVSPCIGFDYKIFSR